MVISLILQNDILYSVLQVAFCMLSNYVVDYQ